MENLQQLGAVLLVLGLLAGAMYCIRNKGLPAIARGFSNRKAFPGVQKRLQVLERVSLTAQHTLCLVRVGDCEMIVTTAPGHCQVMPAPKPTQP